MPKETVERIREALKHRRSPSGWTVHIACCVRGDRAEIGRRSLGDDRFGGADRAPVVMTLDQRPQGRLGKLHTVRRSEGVPWETGWDSGTTDYWWRSRPCVCYKELQPGRPG
ncbi:uncharacterized protein [Periplaneta americana]|uniref:uncharacterized protein n=1 Tax=Periplaneta americana TaxID=6978 RepID=UPI0037E8319D